MTRYADPGRCPDCAHPITYDDLACPGCALPLRGMTAQRLFRTLSTADDLLAALRASATVPAGAAATVGTTRRDAPAGSPGNGAVADYLVARTVGLRLSPEGGLRPPVRRGLSAASVPKILLGLGATCLLVAALVFLAVTWSVLGVGGRTATLLGFTLVTGALATWLARRDLRGAAEALSLVSMGLLTLDVFGARAASWFGELSTAEFLVLLGALLAATGATAAVAARRTAAGALTGVEIVAGIGVAVAAFGIVDNGQPTVSGALVVAVVAAGGIAYAAHRIGLTWTTVLSAATACLAWIGLFATGLATVSPPTLRAMWLERDAWQLLACAALAGAVVLVRELAVPVRVSASAVAYGVLVLTAILPALDESATAATLAVLGALLAGGLVAWFLPRPWGLTGLLVQTVAGLAALVVAAVVSVLALGRLGDAAAAQWAGSTGGRLVGDLPDGMPAPWLAPLCLVALLATGLTAAKASATADRVVSGLTDLRVAVALLAGTLVSTLASYPVPVWTVLLALLVAAAGLLAWWILRQSLVTLGLAAAFAAGAVATSWYDEWLTVAALAAVLLMAGTVHLRARGSDTSAVAGALVVAATVASVWTWGVLLDASAPWVALAGLGLLASVVLTLHLYPDEWWSCDAPAVARTGLEVGAVVAALPLGLAGVLLSAADAAATWTAVYLTVSGAAVTALALLRPDRRGLVVLGGGLLVVASWVRLWDIGVHEPEPYTLPTAAVLLTLGVLRLRRNPDESTMSALGGGLTLALVPSLFWVLDDPMSVRALLLGLACLGLVVAGVRLRWTAPLALGALVGGVEVVRLAAPYLGDAVPRWVLIGATGALLILMGVTWEQRLKETRHALAYVRGLR